MSSNPMSTSTTGAKIPSAGSSSLFGRKTSESKPKRGPWEVGSTAVTEQNYPKNPENQKEKADWSGSHDRAKTLSAKQRYGDSSKQERGDATSGVYHYPPKPKGPWG